MRLLFVIAFTLISGALAAQDLIISGRVLDKNTNSPLPGVSIFVPELNRGVVTDLDGNFKITALPERNTVIQISYVGYSTQVQTLKPSPTGKNVVFQLEESMTNIDEVVISGGYVMSRESSPISIAKMDKLDILKMPSPSLMTALARTPGVSEISLGPGISKPVIRGLSFSRVLSVYQGGRFENQQWGADHGLGLTETGIGNVELIKGPASLIYGSGAMAGVVNLIEEKDASKGDVDGYVNLRAYSNSLGLRTEVGVKGAAENGFVWSLNGALEAHSDYLDGDGSTIGNTRFNTRNIKGGVGLNKKWGNTRLRYTYLKQKLGILDPLLLEDLITTRSDKTIQVPFQNVTDHFVSSETNIFLGEDKIKATFGLHKNLREEIQTNPNDVDLGLRQTNVMYDIKYFKALNPKLELIFGVQGFVLNTINYEDALKFLIPDAKKDDRSLFTLLNYNSEKWVVQGGLRYDYRKVNVDASSPHFVDYGFILPGEPEDRKLERSFDGFTTSAGATFRPDSHWRFRLNIAQGFRAPDLAELFSNGVHPGTNRFERGNSEFQREQNIQTDLGVRYTKNGFSISGEVFYNNIDNYIFFAPTGEVSGNLDIWSFEQTDARLYGGEIELDIQPANLKWVSGTTSYAMVIGQRKSDLTYLPYIPAYRWNQSVDFRLNDIGILGKPYISILGTWVFDQNREAPLEEATPGYYLLGMNIGGNFRFGKTTTDIFLSGTNLLNKTYLDHMSLFRPFGINQMGRNIALNVRVPF